MKCARHLAQRRGPISGSVLDAIIHPHHIAARRAPFQSVAPFARRALATAWALIGTFLAACEPNPQRPVSVAALVQNEAWQLRVQTVQLTTLTSTSRLQGSAAVLVGGSHLDARISEDSLNQQRAPGQTEDDFLQKLFLKDPGGDVRVNWVESNGVLWPTDFHSWNMVSLYRNFEVARTYFAQLFDNTLPESIHAARVLYWARAYGLTSDDGTLADNALFYSPIHSFLVAPFSVLDEVPLAMNVGVISHEYSHLVFSQLAYEGAAFPTPIVNWPSRQVNWLKSADEGFADFHGYGATCVSSPNGVCEPQFLKSSLPASLAQARDISRATVCLSEGGQRLVNTSTSQAFLAEGAQYAVGTVIATALYQAANKTNRLRELQTALARAYSDASASSRGLAQLFSDHASAPEGFTPEVMFNSLIAHIGSVDLRRHACNELVERLGLACTSFPCAAMPACPNNSTRGGLCN